MRQLIGSTAQGDVASHRWVRKKALRIADRLQGLARSVMTSPLNVLGPWASRSLSLALPPDLIAQRMDHHHPRVAQKYHVAWRAIEVCKGDTEQTCPLDGSYQHHTIRAYPRKLDRLRTQLDLYSNPKDAACAEAFLKGSGIQESVDEWVQDYLLSASGTQAKDATGLREAWRALGRLPKTFWSRKHRFKWDFFVEKGYLHYDPIGCGNIPYKVYDLILPSGRRTEVIRLPSPTEQGMVRGLWEHLDLVPEFRSYLEKLKGERKRYLYVNFQNRKGKGDLKGEAERSSFLESLNAENFVLVTLAKNSHFYRQVGRHRHIDNVVEFKQGLMNSLLENDSACFFPDTVKVPSEESFKKDLEIIFERLHQAFFNESSHLTRIQRKDFIELYYLALQDYLVLKVEPDSLSLSCKSCVDRGGGALALFFLNHSIRQDRHLEPEFGKRLQGVLFGAALFAKGRMIQTPQAKRTISAAERLLEGPKWPLDVGPIQVDL